MTARLRATGLVLAAAALLAGASLRPAAAYDILYYTYAYPSSDYVIGIDNIATAVHTLPQASGEPWNLTFYGPLAGSESVRPDDPAVDLYPFDTPFLSSATAPDFAAYDALVIHSGEAFRTESVFTNIGAIPDYSGILGYKAEITAARGSRTVLSATDGDFHAIRGDTGNTLAGGEDPWWEFIGDVGRADAWDGALGYFVNAVEWAAAGDGLGIVVQYDGEFLEADWWEHPDSFIRDEVENHVAFRRDNAPAIDPAAATHPLALGLTDTGLSNWINSFHGIIDFAIRDYKPIIVDDANNPAYALALAKDTGPLAVTAPSGLAAVLLLGWAVLERRRSEGRGRPLPRRGRPPRLPGPPRR